MRTARNSMSSPRMLDGVKPATVDAMLLLSGAKCCGDFRVFCPTLFSQGQAFMLELTLKATNLVTRLAIASIKPVSGR
jgi:hypothetical protein